MWGVARFAFNASVKCLLHSRWYPGRQTNKLRCRRERARQRRLDKAEHLPLCSDFGEASLILRPAPVSRWVLTTTALLAFVEHGKELLSSMAAQFDGMRLLPTPTPADCQSPQLVSDDAADVHAGVRRVGVLAPSG